MQDLRSLKEALKTPKKIIITTHHKPDADALGSSLGLFRYLLKKGHEVNVITPSDYPDFLNWMDGNGSVMIYSDDSKADVGRLVEAAELIFCLDFSSLERINELGGLVAASDAEKVLVDHHQEPEDFAQYKFWDPNAPATAALVYNLIVDLGDETLIDRDIASCLYAGLMTDTGNFKNTNTTKDAFLVAAGLVDKGVNPGDIGRYIYDCNTVDRIKFLGYALSKKLVILPDYHTAYFAITAEELERFNSQTGDTEGLVNYALSIKGIKLAALIVDRTEMIKISFRSVSDFSVNELAKKHFEGGGHKNAAGGKSDLTLEATVTKFETILKEYKEELNTDYQTISQS